MGFESFSLSKHKRFISRVTAAHAQNVGVLRRSRNRKTNGLTISQCRLTWFLVCKPFFCSNKPTRLSAAIHCTSSRLPIVWLWIGECPPAVRIHAGFSIAVWPPVPNARSSETWRDFPARERTRCITFCDSRATCRRSSGKHSLHNASGCKSIKIGNYFQHRNVAIKWKVIIPRDKSVAIAILVYR